MKKKYEMVTAAELAKRIMEASLGTHFDFTFDILEELDGNEPEGWYGVTLTYIFNEPKGLLAIGDYGASGTRIYDLELGLYDLPLLSKTEYKEEKQNYIAKILQEYFQDECSSECTRVCLEVDKEVKVI